MTSGSEVGITMNAGGQKVTGTINQDAEPIKKPAKKAPNK